MLYLTRRGASRIATGIEGTAMKKLWFRHGKLIVVAVAQIIWSTLDDTSTYVPLTDPRMPTVMEVSSSPAARPGSAWTAPVVIAISL